MFFKSSPRNPFTGLVLTLRFRKSRKCFTISFYFSLKLHKKPQNLKSAAYKHADGKKIDGKRVLVDVERARTVKGWLPRRLGGGLGGTRRGGPEVNIKHSGREDNVREKERYRLEREKEDRRGVDDRRGDSESLCYALHDPLLTFCHSQGLKENVQDHAKRAVPIVHVQRIEEDVRKKIMNVGESLARRSESEDDPVHETGEKIHFSR